MVSLLLGVAVVQGAERTITFGVNLALEGSSSYTEAQKDSLIGFTIWQNWWNSRDPQFRTAKDGTALKVALHVETFSGYTYSYANQQALYDTYASMKANTSIDYYFAPVACPFGVALRNYSYYALGMPLMVCTYPPLASPTSPPPTPSFTCLPFNPTLPYPSSHPPL